MAADVAFDELTAGPVKARSGKAHVALADGVLSVTKLNARAFDGAVNGSLTVELQHLDRAHVVLDARGVSVAALEPLIGAKTGVTGRLDAERRRPGRSSRSCAHAEAACVSRRVRSGFPIASRRSATARSMSRRTASAARSRSLRGAASWPGLQVDAQGPATVDGPKGLRVTASGELAKLGPLMGQKSASGHGVLVADLTGRWRDPVVTGKLELRSPALADLRADEIVLPFELTTHSLKLAAASARLGRCATRRIGQSRVASTRVSRGPVLPIRFASISRRRRRMRAWRMRGRGFRRRAAATGRCARPSR